MTSLGRASAILGAGTLISRVTGLIRTIVLVAAIGSIGQASDAFAVANQLPNNVFTIIQTGILTAVIIPQIVRSASHKDGGSAYISKLFTLGTVVFLAVTALAMVIAPWLVALYGEKFSADQLALATAFAYWCLPQIFFYGLYALIGETLNAKRVFGPYTWTPVANNIISIAGFLIFIALFGGNQNIVDAWDPTMIAVLGGTATLGIAVQAGLLLFAWRRTGLSLRPDFRWRGVGLRQVGGLAGWTFLMVIAGQIAGLIQTRVVSDASGEHPSTALMMAAWLVFMLPYSIFAISIGTPYFTQIAEHAAEGRDDDVRSDVAQCIRAVSLFVVGSGVALAVAAVPATRIFTDSAEQAVQAAPVLVCYLVGLLPLSVLFIVQRAFYAYGDTRTPFLFTLVQVALIIGFSYIAAAVAPLSQLAAAVALGQSLAGLVQTIIAVWILRNRLGGLQLPQTLLSLGRFFIAAIPAGFAGWGLYVLMGAGAGWTAGQTGNTLVDKLLGAVGTGVVGLAAVIVYGIVLLLLRAPELSAVTRLTRRFLPSR
ncbi:murein biosynthesis integral membrane protein MurJ [Microbacterium esteraromaticum]|uniref:Murein biosynthesis integral membrane protein MurJ n=1 Tax=Microbacterium esteraromaticum TaxID=57043 RepID=A0A939DUG7_9MICO|nr:murein biosynthesis integral membrane protein MurJ [Microbacterium esteraromaticum]MBN8204679.1 murein biosynthesis integral membrane protein MurJ [Microbacterium esteraromaticum]MBN8414833.1 murein biosynthesis integral membrane protein MurJ [Microbacterium esteraromaticum]